MRAWYNEIDPYAARWLRNLIKAGELPDGEVDERSIVDVSRGDLAGFDQCHFFAGIGVWARAVTDTERRANRRFQRPIWTGSPPCQPLSVAGQRKGHVDQRHLWPAFYRLIAERRPSVVFGEQVASKDGREWLAAVRHDLESVGYAVGAACLPAGGFGAPHIRYRLFFMADAEGRGRRVLGSALESGNSRHIDGGEPIGELADAGEGGRAVEREGWLYDRGSPRHDVARRSEDGWLADAENDGRHEQRGEAGSALLARRQGDSEQSVECSATLRSSPSDSFWSDADWIFCRDGFWRPIEPQSFPLVDGSAFLLGSGGPYEGMSRTGMLRGYGNAVVLPVARVFLEAAIELADGPL